MSIADRGVGLPRVVRRCVKSCTEYSVPPAAAIQRSYAQPRWLISGDSTRSLCSVRPSVCSFVRSLVRCSVRTSVRDGTQTRSDEAARIATRNSPGAPEAARARARTHLLLVFTYLSLSLFHTFSLAPTCLHTRRMYRIYAAAVPSPCVIAEITSRGGARPRVAESNPWARTP